MQELLPDGSLYDNLHRDDAHCVLGHPLAQWAICRDVAEGSLPSHSGSLMHISAMNYLHARSPVFVHGNLTTHNVMLASDSRYGFRAKVSDYGLHRTSFACLASVKWLPKLDQRSPVSREADIFSFGAWNCIPGLISAGVLMYETFTDQDLPETSEARKRFKFVWQPAQNPRMMPQAAYRIISTIWCENPTERLSFEKICAMVGEALAEEESRQGHADARVPQVPSDPQQTLQQAPPPSAQSDDSVAADLEGTWRHNDASNAQKASVSALPTSTDQLQSLLRPRRRLWRNRPVREMCVAGEQPRELIYAFRKTPKRTLRPKCRPTRAPHSKSRLRCIPIAPGRERAARRVH